MSFGEPLLLHSILETAAGRTPNRVAISQGDAMLTFGQALERSRHLAAVLQRRGVKHGDRVTWWADSTIEVAPFYYALAQLGAIFVPMNPRYTVDEAAAIVKLTEPALQVADANHDGEVCINDLLAEPTPSTLELPTVHELDPDVIFCTSGTTGVPKGVVLSHRCNRLRVTSVTSGPFGAVLTNFPQFHWGGWSFIHGAWFSSDEMVLTPSTDAETMLSAIERRKVAKFYAIPGVWRRILSTDRSGFDLSSLREVNTGTSATPPELLRSIGSAFPGTTTSIGYGATEAGGLASLTHLDLFRKPGSVGLIAPGFRTKFVDGELWVKSAQLSSGYYRNPEATAAVFEDGWYRTGDLVEQDDEGYLYVVGRAKELIRTGGEYVAPAEVDVVLMRHPAVADVGVAGVPHVDWGEVVTAFVVVRPGMSVDLDELRRHCQGALAPHKQPRALHVIDAIPRTGPTGQVQRRHLVELAAQIAES